MLPNTSPPSVGAFPKKVTEVRRFASNAELPILVTEFGIVTVVRSLTENASAPMLVTELPIVTLVRSLSWNA